MDYSNQIRIYTPKENVRFTYICEFLFKEIIGIHPIISTQLPQENTLDMPVLFCTDTHTSPFLYVDPWIMEVSVNHNPLKSIQYQGMQVLFPYQGKHAPLLPFDIFSFAFYLISRYEEYAPGQKEDKWGRYLAENSFLYKTKQLQKPIIDILALQLKEILQKLYPQIQFKSRQFKYTPTIDIDSAYLYKGKPLYKNIGGLVKDIGKGKGWERIKVLVGLIPDPFENLPMIEAIHRKYNLESIYFILMANYGGVDKNYAYENNKFQKSLSQLTVGLHSSYASNFNQELRQEELMKLVQIPNANGKLHRQHFLYFKIPSTCHQLLAIGIEHDYTLGYAEEPGFRAGTCTPFAYFDLVMNKPTSLILHPLTFMEVTLMNYKKMKQDEMYTQMLSLFNEVKNVNGQAVSLFHNASFANYDKWKSLLSLYERILKKLNFSP